MSEKPFVSVVIATYNRVGMLRDCLDSFSKQTYPKEHFEVVVVNDGSRDKTEELLREYEEKTPYILRWSTQENKGIAGATGQGIKNAKGSIVCITGDDCIADENWILKLVEGFDSEKVGGVGGKVVTYNPTTIAQRYTEDAGLLNQEKFRLTNCLITGSIAYRKEVFDTIKGFDGFLNACIDLDISIQVQLAGYELRYAPDAVILHRHKPTIKGLYKQQYRNAIGYARLNRKYRRHFSPFFNLLIWSYRLFSSVVKYPFVMLFVFSKKEDRKYGLVKPLLDIMILVSFISGSLKEVLFGRPYPEKTIDEKVTFLEEQSVWLLLVKIGRKAGLK